MDMRKCEKGHFYDGEVNAACPVCEAEKRNSGAFGIIGSRFEEIGATEALKAGDSRMGGDREIGVTEPIGHPSGYESGESRTVPPERPSMPWSEFGRSSVSGGNGVEDYSGETAPVDQKGFTPVVGWLVCTQGPNRGKDYRIRTGYNHIGRAEHMDICLRGDNSVSREKHALIAYDDLEKTFFFGPSDGKNIVRVNDRMIMVPTEIKPFDYLTVGSSRLIFVPLCGEHFDWNA
ncbi:MAG: hypothetical protein LUF78_12660 [Clostridiales bacterium]|nr:hypothetical protein [Clostridiales bacterium]